MNESPYAVTLILGALREHPEGLNILAVASETGLNRMSAAKYLEVMTALDAVAIRWSGRAKVYFLPRRLPVTTLLEHSSKCCCVTDSRLRVVQFNHYLPAISGLTPREIDGILLPEIFGDRIENFGECLEACREALAGTAGTVVADDRFRGRCKFLEIHHVPVRFPDGSHGMMAVSQDITKWRHTEIELHKKAERLQRLVEHLTDVVVEINTGGIVTYVSPRVAGWGLLPHMFCGRAFADLAVPEDREKVLAGLSAVVSAGRETFRFRAAAPDGRVLRITAECSTVRDAAGACTGIICLLRDVKV